MPHDRDERIDDPERLAKLIDNGHISQEEFEELRAELLHSPASPSSADRPRVDDSPGTRPQITQAEYEVLKHEVLEDGSVEGIDRRAENPSDVPGAIAREVLRLRDLTYTSLDVTRAELERVDRAGLATLKGTDLFVQGVEAHTRMVLAPGTDLRNLIEVKPGFMPIAAYLGVIQTIDTMLSKIGLVQIPPEVRGFMATYGMLAWEWLVESGHDFDPGKGNSPAELFQRLGLT